ncbi:DCAF13 [Mytilus edulis]|uniref:DCAF13 n=1 Tax=Mytilus edulis TaxID=6550 RepID=A0A8S3Q2G4_MYTED|nr:DCAF13 [Mytilus edulis]
MSALLQVGNDKTIKQWSLSECGQIEEEPQSTILGKTIFTSIDHRWSENNFATCGQQLDIWDEDRTEPVRSFTLGVDSLHAVKFNPIETNIVGSCASDRSIISYDMRGAAPLRKFILLDMRKLSMPVTVHMDHLSAVIDVDYSPTGRAFASAGYDKVVRIFPADRTHSREIYHTNRMQRVETVRWSLDNKYILSGSDEMNIRIWKAQAPEKLGVLKPREKTAFNYNSKLKEKFSFHPEVKRISRHRHVLKMIYNQQKEMRIIRQSQKKKEANRRKHSKPGAVPFVPERKKSIIKEVE